MYFSLYFTKIFFDGYLSRRFVRFWFFCFFGISTYPWDPHIWYFVWDGFLSFSSWAILDPRELCQIFNQRPRESSNAHFPHIFKHWLWMEFKIPNYSLRSNFLPFLSKISPTYAKSIICSPESKAWPISIQLQDLIWTIRYLDV